MLVYLHAGNAQQRQGLLPQPAGRQTGGPRRDVVRTAKQHERLERVKQHDVVNVLVLVMLVGSVKHLERHESKEFAG